MEDPPLEKIAISGPTLASLIQRISSSPGDVDGLLFGHVTQIAPSTLSDDATSTSSSYAAAGTAASSTSSSSSSSHIVAIVTSFLCFSSTFTFYDSLGRLHHQYLLHLHHHEHHDHHLLGWFSARRKTPLRPSMRETAVTNSLSSSKSQLSFSITNSPANFAFTPSVFVLFATPLHDQLIHTHEYRAYQFLASAQRFDPKSIDVVNIGPAFRGHYGNFNPNNAGLPWLSCEMPRRISTGGSSCGEAMNEDRTVVEKKAEEKQQQKVLDSCAEGFRVENLGRLIGPEAANYSGQLEDLYEKMLCKIETLARLVETSEAKIHEQEDHNRMLRSKVARLSGTE